MSLKKLFVAIPALIVILGARDKAALADHPRDKPHTRSVAGAFHFSPVDVKQRTCLGEDGPYLELRGRWEGATAGTDPRLSGDLEFTADFALVNLATGLGTFQGSFTITDPVTGDEKVHGGSHVVVTNGGRNNHGFLFGNVRGANRSGDDEDERSDIVFANFTSAFDPALNVKGVYGGAGDPQTPAVTQGGRCEGPFTRVR